MATPIPIAVVTLIVAEILTEILTEILAIVVPVEGTPMETLIVVPVAEDLGVAPVEAVLVAVAQVGVVPVEAVLVEAVLVVAAPAEAVLVEKVLVGAAPAEAVLVEKVPAVAHAKNQEATTMTTTTAPKGASAAIATKNRIRPWKQFGLEKHSL